MGVVRLGLERKPELISIRNCSSRFTIPSVLAVHWTGCGVVSKPYVIENVVRGVCDIGN